jgi:DNA topoisomerase VI subunit A
VPRARFLGISPRDIVDFGLDDVTHPLSTTDIKRAEDALQNDPFIMAHPSGSPPSNKCFKWAFGPSSRHWPNGGLNYVIDDYLPKKLANANGFLP